MTIVRASSGARFYIDERHYRNLGWLFITMSVVWFYFTYTEHLTMLAGQDAVEWPVLASKLWGADAPLFWLMLALMLLAILVLSLPVLLPARISHARFFRPRLAAASATSAGVAFTLGSLPQALPVVAGLGMSNLRPGLLIAAVALAVTATISALAWLKAHVEAHTVIASVAVVAGMWLERWNIIIPTLTHPRMIAWASYTPTVTEWSLTAASFALFVLLMLIFFKLFPAVSLWEVEEGRVVDTAQSLVEIPLPRPVRDLRQILPGQSQEPNMNFPQDSPIFQFLYWLVNTPGLGGVAVVAVVATALGSFAVALRWIVSGGQVDDPITYAYPTSALHHHE